MKDTKLKVRDSEEKKQDEEVKSPAAAVQDGKEILEHQIIRELIKKTKKKEYRYSYYVERDRLVTQNRPERFLEAFAAVLQHSNYRHIVDLYSRIGARCSRCTAMCQVFQASGDPRHIPCYRTKLLLDVYRRHFTLGGWVRGKLSGNGRLTDERLDELAEAVYKCTACRRCALECPMGIDHGLMTHLARYILSEIGLAPKALVVATREQLEGATRNTSAVPVAALKDTVEFLEEELAEMFGFKGIGFPLDREGVEYVFFPAVSDYLLEPDTLMGNAAAMYAAGDADNWTIGTRNFDGINYGLFYSDFMLGRIIRQEVAECRRLGRTILIGECGHASRSAKFFVPVYGQPDPPPVVNIMEYTCRRFLEGKLRLKPKVIEERVTYHDPCNIARSKWIIEQPRILLRHICRDFVDMTPGGQYNLCCGGGGGTVSIDEIRRFRTTVMGGKKADQIKDTGAHYVVAPCANCKKQVREVCEDNGLDGVQVVGLHDLLLKAFIFD
ncbi:MAG: (Fe-S)-binding protein [bacterium]